MAQRDGRPHYVSVMYVQKTDVAVRYLLPYMTEPHSAWVSRWTLILSEVTRRSERMGLEYAAASVRDDLEAGRL